MLAGNTVEVRVLLAAPSVLQVVDIPNIFNSTARTASFGAGVGRSQVLNADGSILSGRIEDYRIRGVSLSRGLYSISFGKHESNAETGRGEFCCQSAKAKDWRLGALSIGDDRISQADATLPKFQLQGGFVSIQPARTV